MKIRLYCITIMAVSISAMMLCGSLFAQGSSEEREAEQSAAKEMSDDENMSATEMQDSVDGEVAGVDPSAGTMTVVETDFDNEPYIFFVNKNTSFSGSYSFSDLRIGDQVKVDYYYMSNVNNMRTADNVVIGERGPEAARPNVAEAYTPVEKVLRD